MKKNVFYWVLCSVLAISCQQQKQSESDMIRGMIEEASLSDMPPQMIQTLGIYKNVDFLDFSVLQRQHITYANDADTSNWVRKNYIIIENKSGQQLGLEVEDSSQKSMVVKNLSKVNVSGSISFRQCGVYRIDTSCHKVPTEMRTLWANWGKPGVYMPVLWAKENLFFEIDNGKWVDVKLPNTILTNDVLFGRLKGIFDKNNTSISQPNSVNVNIFDKDIYVHLPTVLRDIEERAILKNRLH